MKLKINYQNLTDSSYSNSANTNAFIFEDASHLKDAMEQLKADLKHDFPSVFLISGYRGVGKTSMIEKVVDDLEKDSKNTKKNIIVKLPITKYKDHKDFLWKLIRALFSSFEKEAQKAQKEITAFKPIQRAKNLLNEPKPKSDRFNEHFALLSSYYARTFNAISKVKSSEKKQESTETETHEFDLKKFVAPLTVLFAGSANLFYSLGKWVNFELLHILITILPPIIGAWWTATTYKLSQVKKKVDTEIDKFESKELFDEGIAEDRILDLLKNLKKDNYQVIIILDELDKIEDKKKLNEFFSHLKGFLLSNHARFILIDSLHLQLESNKPYEENNVLDSLFSKRLHVGLPNKTFLQRWFERHFHKLALAQDSNINEDKILSQDFLDHLILRSFRVPRKFIGIMSQKVYWENEIAYINTDNGKTNKLLKEDAVRLQCVETTIKRALDPITDMYLHEKDIFISHLHQWAISLINSSGQNGEFKMEISESDKQEDLMLSNDLFNERYKSFISKLFTAFKANFTALINQDSTNENVHNHDIQLAKHLWANKSMEIFAPHLKFIKNIMNLNMDIDDFIFLKSIPALHEGGTSFEQSFNQLDRLQTSMEIDADYYVRNDNPNFTTFASVFFKDYTMWLFQYLSSRLNIGSFFVDATWLRDQVFDIGFDFHNDYFIFVKSLFRTEIYSLDNEFKDIKIKLERSQGNQSYVSSILVVYTAQKNASQLIKRFQENNKHKGVILPIIIDQEVANKMELGKQNELVLKIEKLGSLLNKDLDLTNLQEYCTLFLLSTDPTQVKEIHDHFRNRNTNIRMIDIHKALIESNNVIRFIDNNYIDTLTLAIAYKKLLPNPILFSLGVDEKTLNEIERINTNN